MLMPKKGGFLQKKIRSSDRAVVFYLRKDVFLKEMAVAGANCVREKAFQATIAGRKKKLGRKR